MSNVTHLGHYEVVETLLETASVSVYFARMSWGDGQTSTVVLKAFDRGSLPPGLAETDLHSGIARYRALVGETLVRLLDVFETPERVVLVLEHVDGLGLDTLLARLPAGGVVLDDDAVIYMMGRVFAALAIAHEALTPDTQERAPIVHGEIQPSSMMLTADGRVCLGEFPLTTFVAPWRSILTTKDRVASSHMAPEQITRGVATVRSDVYSATLVLWELLARRPHADTAPSDIDRLMMMAEPEVPPLERIRPDLDPRVLDVVRRGLVVSESLRALTAGEVARTLGACVVQDTGRVKLRQAIARAIDISAPLGAASFAVQRTSMAPAALGGAIGSVRRVPLQGGVGAFMDDIPPSALSFSGLDVAGHALTDSTSAIAAADPHSGSWFGTDSSATPVGVPLPDYSNLSIGDDLEHTSPDVSFGTPAPRRIRWVGALLAVSALGIGGVWGLGHRRAAEQRTRHASQVVAVDASAAAPSPLVTTSPAVVDAGTRPMNVPQAVVADAGVAPTRGTVSTARWPKGFRVFVDGQVVGETPGDFEVRCGTHKIKVGSAGWLKTVSIPCGATYLPPTQ